MTLDTFPLSFFLQLLDASAPLLFRDTHATDQTVLVLSDTRVDIDILDWDPQWAIFWPDEPAVDLPTQIQEDEKRTSQVELEKRLCIQARATDWVQCDVELSYKADDVDEQAQIGAPNSESGPEGELVQGMTVVFPVDC